MMVHDLLSDPLLSWRNSDHHRARTTLPGLLARITIGELMDFPRVRAHQFHPWCMFLAQLAAIALRRAGESVPPRTEVEWCERLLALTAGAREPWCLVVEDLQKPAFFQPPVPEGQLNTWNATSWPDEIDILVNAKNHDVKTMQIPGSDWEAWAYAMVTLQTTQGYPGRGYNPIARMKGGYGNRPRVGVAIDHSVQTRFLRDVEVLLSSWPQLVERGYADNGIGLAWTEPWDGATSLTVAELAPHFIEVCWRIRLGVVGVGGECRFTTTRARRCAAEVENGDVGDVWIPIERDGGALTVGSSGFSYPLLVRLLFSNDFEPCAAQRIDPGSTAPAVFLAAAMARGQGKTEGLHERILPLPANVRWRLGQPDLRDALARRCSERVERAATMRQKVLYPSLKQLALGEDVPPDTFATQVDGFFFDHLFETLDAADEAARLSFEERLRGTAWDELQRAVERCCVPSAQRWRATSAAERMFTACLHKHFADLAQAGQRSEEQLA